MRFNLFLFASLGFIPGLLINAAQAQGVADPQAKVPAPIYRSVFQGAEPGVVSDAKGWREANDEVGQFRRGHIDVLKWEEQGTQGKADTKPPATNKVAP